ncbi:type IV toxin-antitoxin system AbiEi family antitoxin domain-containing protein [Arthrobacter sp. Rue61a]|uniref:type IV toxin-antitoxin system AbiEi family antitoxin domain-containing protein n=1 Tax=Arthrobacter sp. Rue61a TaxID=1118963 RepID=UPI00027DF415|nr:type IV toxin-antitoxin system AbiEi family antitoxin domain-containing protein [Arthrobacter sp. Rue61a]AFR30751.1 hypothetical protein ARUE_c38730 [Arthrobacter sp. Rue61a]
MKPEEALRQLGGVALTRQVQGRGVSEKAIRAALQAGSIQRVERGVLGLPGAAPEFVAAVRARSLLTCASAAGRYGLWLLHKPAEPHYWQNNGRRSAGCISHRTSLSQPRRSEPFVALPDVLLHALLCLPPLESLVMVESAYIRGDITLDYLRRHLVGNRGGQARNVLAKVDRGAGSLIETLARVLFRDVGIRTETQVWIEGVGTVDFLLEGFLIVEIDGIASHMEPRQFKKDRRRDNEAIRQGMLVLRFFYDDVVHAPERMLRHVREVLLRGPARMWSD